VLPTLTSDCAVAFLRRAVAWFAARGIRVKAVMTDNGSAYVSHAHGDACRDLGVKHLRIRPARPRTNGKAERFIQTLQNEWAYGRIYGSSAERAAALPLFLTHCNFRRPHGSLGHKPPASRLTIHPAPQLRRQACCVRGSRSPSKYCVQRKSASTFMSDSRRTVASHTCVVRPPCAS